MKRSGLPTPLPKSAAAATRCERRRRFVVDDRALQPDPRSRRTGDAERAGDEPDLVGEPVPDVIAVEELELGGAPAAGGGGVTTGGEIVSATSTGCGRKRSATARTTSTSSASSAASIHCTFLPGRNVRATTCIGASGTGRNSSTVNRATNDAGPGS